MIIGADAYGDKDFLGIMDGFHENTDSQRNFLQSLKKQGQTIALDLACGSVLWAVAPQYCGTCIQTRENSAARSTRWPIPRAQYHSP